jgi:hypothetical protein
MAGDSAHGIEVRSPIMPDFEDFTPEEIRTRKGYGAALRGWLPRWSLPRSLVTILTAAVTADSHTDPRELKALLAAIERSRTMRNLSINAQEELFDMVHKSLGLDQWSQEPQPDRVKNLKKIRTRALKKATRIFVGNPHLRKALFLQALDILLADQTVLPSEIAFMRELAVMLNMEANDVAACQKLILTKNAH